MNPEKVLPPGVNGKITGQLVVKVDEIFWARNSPGGVFVQLQWWGEKECILFSPEDITLNEPKKNVNTSVTYNIRTSPGLFESYLRNCGIITFTVVRGQNKNVILGTAVINDVEQIIRQKNYHSYFSVLSPKGNRIADLHICFELTLTPIGTNFTLKDTEENCKTNLQHIPKSNGEATQPSYNYFKSARCREDKLLSNILHKGHELRKAMVMSVLADCPIDNLESFVNYCPNTDSIDLYSSKEEAQLVDFLLGKHMSAEEEMKALETLRCISPGENIFEKAKIAAETYKPNNKMKCCLHGHECGKITKNEAMAEQTSTTTFLETNSTVPEVSKTEEEVIHFKDENIKQKKFDCYRIVISSLKLSLDGSRKIFYAPCMNEASKSSKQFGRNHNPPGTSFILEVTIPSKGGAAWARKIKFFTKKFKGTSVDFSQGTTHRLCGLITWTRVRTLLIGSIFTLYWRHLNQRVPCPLGSTKLEQLNPEAGADSVFLSLPVYSNTRLLTGHLNVTISIGTLRNLREEALFYIDKKTENKYENTEHLHSSSSPQKFKTSIEPSKPVSPVKSASTDYSDSDDVFPVPSFDDELMKTIDLLNSKPNETANKKPVIEKQEASIQTTLPFTIDCPTCHCQEPAEKDIKDRSPKKCQVSENGGKSSESSHFFKTPHCDSRAENWDYKKFISEDHFHPHMEYPPDSEDSGIPSLPVEFEMEKIHEFTVKIEKVFGIPLFASDNDLDCYVDYSFPKLDRKGKMVFGQVTNGTDIRMALRETDFNAVNRHRLRLNCKLTTALLTLPVHEITFSIWGRYYRPTPRDYKLGKATVPLERLSELELVYCQQIKSEPIYEKIVVPISVIDSSITSGYIGSFGELHILLGYSCTSSSSYRQWKEQMKDRNYLYCQQGLRNRENEDVCRHDMINPNNSYNQFKKRETMNGILPANKMNPTPEYTHNSKISIRNGLSYQPELVQYNFNHQNSKHFMKASSNINSAEKQDVHSQKNMIVKSTLSREREPCIGHDLHSEIILNNISENELYKCSSHKESTNIMDEVLIDMKERQIGINHKPKSPVFTTTPHPQSAPVLSDIGACGDAFQSFDLKVDLPSRGEESIDFEVRSQYSFLHSPPIPPLFLNQNSNVALESESSSSIKGRIEKGNPVNPFSSLSNMSFSINRESSLFNVQQTHDQLCNVSRGVHSKKEVSPIDADVHFSQGQKNSVGESLNENNSHKFKKNKKIQKNSSINSDSDKENVVSSDATLNSVESIKSFKEELKGRESKDVGVETEFISLHKDTQTSNISYQEEQYFKAQVQICRALGLPSVDVRQSNGKIGTVKPTSYAYFSARMNGQPKVLKTEVVEKKSNPIWNKSWNVELPAEFLKKCDRELEIFVDLNGGAEESVRTSDCSSQWPITLRTGVDLTPITAGLEHASGWFSLSDRSLLSRSQLKVVVTPLEDASRFRNDWLKEYTKAKGRKVDVNFPHSSSIANSLQEKLKELEKLTERMRNKMDDRPNWNKSPPYDLISEVQAVRFSQDQIELQSTERSGVVQRVEAATSPALNLFENDLCSPINIDEEEEENSAVQTYNVDAESESSHHDSLETPSETIERIVSKMRKRR